MEIHLSDHFTYKKILRFTFPAMVMMVFTSLYGVVDGIFVTNFAGKTALAAVNFVFPVINIIGTLGYMFGAGGSALVAKTLGEGKKEKANSLFSLFVYLTTVVGVLFAVVGFFTLKSILIMFGANGEMLRLALVYGNILLAALPLWNLQFLFQIFFVTAEKPKLGLYVTVLAGVTNMVLDGLFVGILGWGIIGAAVATALSQLVGGGIPVIYFIVNKKVNLRLGKTEIDVPAILKATSNGLSEFVSGVSGSLVGILYNIQLMKYAGEDGVAAYGAIMYVCFIFIGIFFGYVNGIAPVVGYHYGAQNHSELKNLLKKSVTLAVTAAVVMFSLAELCAVPLSMLFAGYDANLYKTTLDGFEIYSISFLFTGVAVLGPSFFTALNNGIVSALLSFLRTVVFQVSLVVCFPLFFGVHGIWYSVVGAEALSAMMSVLFLILMRKKYNY